jgi:hypothetical protein
VLLPHRVKFYARNVSIKDILQTRRLLRNPINILEIIEMVRGRSALETPNIFLSGNAVVR